MTNQQQEPTMQDLFGLLSAMVEQNKTIIDRFAREDAAIERKASIAANGLHDFSQTGNLELTIFDNGESRKKGVVRWRVKAEINLTEKVDFRSARDITQFADVFPIWEIDTIVKKKISEEYKKTLQNVFLSFPKEKLDYIMLGLFGKRGGPKGQIWYEDQYILLFHDGAYNFIGARIHNKGAIHFVDDFRTCHLNGKPFSNDKLKDGAIIKAKSVSYPCQDELAKGEND